MIVGLFTDLLAAGGVQRAGRHTAAVLARFAESRGVPYRFLSLNDPRGSRTLQLGESAFRLTGFERSKRDLILAALSAAKCKPALVVAMHPHLAPVAAAMKLRSPISRTVIFSHGIEVWRPLAWPRGASLRGATLLIAPSEDTARHLVSSQQVSPDRIQRLAWGLDPDFEQRLRASSPPARPAVFPADARVILTVGRWDPAERYKGADTLISALPGVLQAIPSAFLVLVGDGGDRPRLEQLAETHGVVHRTCFLHGLTAAELFACYAYCDLFALPSKGEGFGLVFLEAMAHGKPVIGGAHGGIPGVIEDNVTGILVQHGDVAQLSAALQSLLSTPARAAEMGARARQRAQSLYTYDKFQSNLWRILESVLDAPGSAGEVTRAV